MQIGAVVALLSVTLQTPTDHLIHQAGIGPIQTLLASAGRVALPDGAFVQLLGCWDYGRTSSNPWDISGLKLATVDAKWFWHSIDINPKSVQGKEEAAYGKKKKRFALGFRIHGNFMVEYHGDRPNLKVDVSNSRPPEPELGFPDRTEGFALTLTKQMSSLGFQIEVRENKGVDLFQFDDVEAPEHDGFSFQILSRASKAFRATREKRVDVPMKQYLIVADIPPKYKDVEFEIKSNDQIDKNDLALSTGFQMPGEAIDPSLRGKVAFELMVKDIPNFKRKFTLTAIRKYVLEFRDIPLKPKSDHS